MTTSLTWRPLDLAQDILGASKSLSWRVTGEGTALYLAARSRPSSDQTGYRYALLEQARILVVPGPGQFYVDHLRDPPRTRAEHNNPVGDKTSLEAVVGDEEHRLSRLLPKPQQQFPHGARGQLVQSAERFVHQEELRVHRECPGDGGALLHPAG